MTDDEFLGLAYEGMFGEIEADHRASDQPAHTALLHRTFPTYTESMWIQAYPHVRLVTITCPAVRMREDFEMPGFVREIPIGWRDMRSAETMRTRFELVVGSYVALGWSRKEHEIR